jgi:4-alpha-glucanotransferase
LAELARAAGILEHYHNPVRNDVHHTGRETKQALLLALGFDVISESSLRDGLRLLQQRAAAALSVRVATPDEAGFLRFALPASDGSARSASCEVTLEGGEVRTTTWPLGAEGEGDSHGRTVYSVPFDFPMPLGYHELTLRVGGGAGADEYHQKLIVAPVKCAAVRDALGEDRAFGLSANLYSVRARRDVGVGNISAVVELLELASRIGAGQTGGRRAEFVGINPLHAPVEGSGDVSPYSPSSRLFRNPLYLDPWQIPELAHSEMAQRRLRDMDTLSGVGGLRSSDQRLYREVKEFLWPILRELHDVFRNAVAQGGSRRADYTNYRNRQGELLDRFATFQATLHRVEGSATTHDESDVDFHRYLQFELDRQLAVAHQTLLQGGMRIGLYSDLAIGASSSGFDAWAYPQLFAQGVSVGAPPDHFAPAGQSWGTAPLSPHILRNSGYEYWSAVLRGSFEHAGMLRIDHVMGLWRQFWVPDGMSAADGAYVEYPSGDLLGILALESCRARAIVVGEDLGTVPPVVRPELERRGILSCKVLYFERESDGGFTPPERYSPSSLVMANTHDLPTLCGWWMGRDLLTGAENELSPSHPSANQVAQATQLPQATQVPQVAEAARIAQRSADRLLLAERLVTNSLLSVTTAEQLLQLPVNGTLSQTEEPLLHEFVTAVHELICGSGSALVALSLDDLALELDQVNRPGVSMQDWGSWSRKMRTAISEIAGAV